MPEEFHKSLYLICTGNGITPFLSMVQYLQSHQKIKHRDIHLIFGFRKFEDGLYFNELRELALKEDLFFFHPVYSREQGGLIGYIKGMFMMCMRNCWPTKKNLAGFICAMEEYDRRSCKKYIGFRLSKK